MQEMRKLLLITDLRILYVKICELEAYQADLRKIYASGDIARTKDTRTLESIFQNLEKCYDWSIQLRKDIHKALLEHTEI